LIAPVPRSIVQSHDTRSAHVQISLPIAVVKRLPTALSHAHAPLPIIRFPRDGQEKKRKICPSEPIRSKCATLITQKLDHALYFEAKIPQK
jgi:hypothetical protein